MSNVDTIPHWVGDRLDIVADASETADRSERRGPHGRSTPGRRRLPGERRVNVLFADSTVSLVDVACYADDRSWSAVESSERYALVLVRAGGFRQRTNGRTTFVDSSTVYFERPGDERQMAHPVGGDSCSVVAVGDDLLAALQGEPALPDRAIATSEGLDLYHRRLVALLRRGLLDRIEAAAGLQDLVERVLAEARSACVTGDIGRHDGRTLVADAREILTADRWSVGLLELGRRLGRSPFHLSRTFTSEAGESFTQYRRRLRVRAALERLDAGEDNLARLAADLGFADHSHLVRAMRQVHGMTPTGIRRLFGSR